MMLEISMVTHTPMNVYMDMSYERFMMVEAAAIAVLKRMRENRA